MSRPSDECQKECGWELSKITLLEHDEYFRFPNNDEPSEDWWGHWWHYCPTCGRSAKEDK
jgi:hypothetical protein